MERNTFKDIVAGDTLYVVNLYLFDNKRRNMLTEVKVTDVYEEVKDCLVYTTILMENVRPLTIEEDYVNSFVVDKEAYWGVFIYKNEAINYLSKYFDDKIGECKSTIEFAQHRINIMCNKKTELENI